MNFNVNSPVLFVIAGVIIAAVLAQSVYFLIKAWKRGLAIGMEKAKLKRIARTAAVFTIGRLRGMRTASILNNVVVCGEDTADAIGGYVDGESLTAAGERNEIRTALEALYRLDREGQA